MKQIKRLITCQIITLKYPYFGVYSWIKKNFQCKREDFKKWKTFWFPLLPLRGSGATATIFSSIFNFAVKDFLSVVL